MARSESTIVLSRTFALWCGVVVVATLYIARDVLLPLALAILLSFLLAPVVKRLEKWGAGRVPAVVVVVCIAFGGLGALGYLLTMQMVDLASRLPQYQENIVAKVEFFQNAEQRLVNSVSGAIGDLQKKVSHKAPDANASRPTTDVAGGAIGRPSTADAAPPTILLSPDAAIPNAGVLNPSVPNSAVPVAVQKTATASLPSALFSELSLERLAQSVLGPMISPLGTAALVVIFVVFMLIERENLRNRFIHLIGSRQLNVTTQALDDAASRVSRYLFMQLILNASIGIVVAVGLFLIGVPNAPVWGMLATLLRFVPYVGPWIAAVMPILLAAAVFQGWTRPLLVVALFVADELVATNLIEPWLYRSSTGISTMGILVSSVFWMWLWGPVGLVMATPLTVCLAVLGRYAPQLSFLNTLLSNEEVLSPDARFYQRLLAMDPEEATDIAEEYLKDHSLESLYDKVLLPALSLAEQDRHQGDLDESRQRFILKAMRELVDELGANARHTAGESSLNGHIDAAAEIRQSKTALLCLPARDEADEIAGVMLSQLMAAKGIPVVLASVQSLTSEMLTQVSEEAPDVVCVSALPPLAATHARYLCKRLRPKFPELKIVVGLWQTGGNNKQAQARLMETGIDRLVTSLADATQYLTQVVGSQRLLASAAVTATDESCS